MQSDLFICSVCFLHFDDQARIPKLIPTCGHTFCLACLTDIINKKRECPSGCGTLSDLLKTGEQFPTNIALRQALDTQLNGNYETCTHHNKLKHLVCLRDHVQICEECRLNHKGHSIKPLKELKDKAKAHKEKLKSLVKDFERKKDEAELCIKDFRKSTATILERGFNKAREILKQREKEIFNKFNSLLEVKKGEIGEAIEEDGLLKEKYEVKIADLNDLSSSQRFFRTLDKLEKTDMRNFKIDRVLNDIELIKGQYIPVLETQTDSLVSSIEKLDFERLTNISVSVKEIGDLKVNIPVSDLETLLDMKMEGTQLVITPRNPASKGSYPPLDLSMWKDITWFEVHLNEGDLTLEHFQALKKAYSYCMNITAFSLQAKNKDFTDYHLIRFVSDPFWATSKTQELWFNFRSSQVSDMGLTKLVTESLVTMRQVQRFCLLVNKKTTDKSVLALATHFISTVINLEIFHLQILQTKITDSGIVELFKSLSRLMDKIKSFTLNLSSTQITDQSLVAFSQENLKWGVNLKFLQLVLNNTQITDHGFKTFCEIAKSKLQKTRKFGLILTETHITDQSISEFGNNVLPNMVSLNHLIISMPPNTTDSSIHSLCGGLDKIIKNLEQFKLFISYTKISENGIQMIIKLVDLKSLTRLRVFGLVFNGISVNDFIRGQINEIKKQLSLRNKEN